MDEGWSSQNIFGTGLLWRAEDAIIAQWPRQPAQYGYCPHRRKLQPIVVKIAGKPVDLDIIQVYAPTANSNDEDLEKFYNDLNTAKTQCKSQDPLIIMGDFNAKVGTDKVDDIVGKHGLGIRNERVEKLIE
ncbi:craniofacial development protein 2-like protein [Plakobranchus ocellatus]|uniref:Craniofacial development protein 2-like protein n=1 Tax=Plakobranchus ocellatus TaxID=259542 RepID=A0AAV4AFV1_9GAST|nr:craniofacial development protein 2-like protein [Plakobranchus ocellatus]